MPAKGTRSSPRLDITISPEQYARAVQADSGACLIADAIRAQYPHLSGVSVDMATIRVTDRKRGLRYTYLTPDDAQMTLLAFDQGWDNPHDRLVIKSAVKIAPVTRAKSGRGSIEQVRTDREAKRAALEAKLEAGETLSTNDKRALTRLRKPYEPVERPSTTGAPEVIAPANGARPTVVGGTPIRQGEAHPNLLRSRNRHFGAKTSQPGVQFQQAVEELAQQRAAELMAQQQQS